MALLSIPGALHGLLHLRSRDRTLSQLGGPADRALLRRRPPCRTRVKNVERASRLPVIASSSSAAAAGGEAAPAPEPTKAAWDNVLRRLNGSQAPPSLSDIVWPSLGGFVTMVAMGVVDKLLAPKGLSFTMGSFGPTCALLFAAPKSPVSQKYNVYVSHLGCAAVGVIALGVFGPGSMARAVALAAAIAFMQYTGSLHPPAAGLPLILIDMQKMQPLKWWYVVFPGFMGCVFLFMLQEAVEYLKENWKF